MFLHQKVKNEIGPINVIYFLVSRNYASHIYKKLSNKIRDLVVTSNENHQINSLLNIIEIFK